MTARRIVANITVTLDGRITGPGGNADMMWVVPHAFADEIRDHMVSMTSTASTALMGSVNAEGFFAVWPMIGADPASDARDRAFSRWLTATDKMVLSSSGQSSWPDARIESGDTASIVRQLQMEQGDDILVLSSVSVIMGLLGADLVDVLHLVLVPEILEGGRRLWEGDLPRGTWSLASTLVAASGAIRLTYERVRG